MQILWTIFTNTTLVLNYLHSTFFWFGLLSQATIQVITGVLPVFIHVGRSVWNGAIKATHPNKCHIACGRSSQHTQISLEERAFVPSGHAWLGHGVMPPHQCKTVDIYHLSSKAFSL